MSSSLLDIDVQLPLGADWCRYVYSFLRVSRPEGIYTGMMNSNPLHIALLKPPCHLQHTCWNSSPCLSPDTFHNHMMSSILHQYNHPDLLVYKSSCRCLDRMPWSLYRKCSHKMSSSHPCNCLCWPSCAGLHTLIHMLQGQGPEDIDIDRKSNNLQCNSPERPVVNTDLSCRFLNRNSGWYWDRRCSYIQNTRDSHQ